MEALERFEGPLVRYAARLLGDEDSARDVVQHAFLRLCDQTPDKVADRVGPWLFAVCRNRAVDLIRVQGRMSSLESEHPDPPGREPDPAQTAERDETLRRLSELVAELPPARREVIDLWSAGFSYVQIAQIAGYTEVNVRVLVHRAVKQLRVKMGGTREGMRIEG
jgi:RNA polymerase sigma factor (sigma-70 family)